MKRGVWGEKVFGGDKLYLGVKRAVRGIMVVFRVQMGWFGGTGVLGGENGCQSILGCLGSKWGVLRCLRVKGVFGVVKGCGRHNWVFGVQTRCWSWGERGVW